MFVLDLKMECKIEEKIQKEKRVFFFGNVIGGLRGRGEEGRKIRSEIIIEDVCWGLLG